MPEKNSKIQICDAVIHPGEFANLALPLPELYTCTAMYMPIKVLHGANSGPCCLVFAAANGTELNGFEIINRLLKDDALNNLSGTIIAVPVLNIYGMVNYPQRLPSGVSIDKCFPGKENGSYGERLAHIFTKEILSKADYCVELQTGNLNYNILPQVYCNFDNLESKQLAKVFGAPVVTNVSLDNNQLRETTENLNIPLIVYEAGEAMRFDESAIGLGLLGIKKVLNKIGIISTDDLPDEDFKPLFSQDDDWLRASKGGVLRSLVTLGQHIKKDEKIGVISDPFSADLSEPIHSKNDGIVVGINENPLIFEGQQIIKVASFIDNDRAETAIENWEEPTT